MPPHVSQVLSRRRARRPPRAGRARAAPRAPRCSCCCGCAAAPGCRPAPRPRRAALRAGGGGDAARAANGSRRRCRASRGSRSRRSTTGWRGPPSACSGRPRPRRGCPRCWPPLLLVGRDRARGRAALRRARAGLHAGFVAGHVAPVLRLRPRAPMDMLLAATSPRRSALLGLRAPRDRGTARACPRPGVFAGLATLAKGPLGAAAAGARRRRYAAVARDRAAWRPARRPAGRSSWPVPARRRALVRRSSGAPRAALRGRLPAQPQPPALHVHDPQPPGPVSTTCPCSWRASSRGRACSCPALGAPPAARHRARTCFVLLLARCCRSLFFSLAGSKLPGYILPCLPPLALLIGRAGGPLDARRARGPAGAWRRSSAWPRRARRRRRRSCLRAQGEPRWRAAVPLAAWALIVAFALLARDRAATRAARCACCASGAAGLLLLADRRAADPGRARVGRDALPARRRARGAGLGRLAHGLDGRLLLQRRARAGGGGLRGDQPRGRMRGRRSSSRARRSASAWRAGRLYA